uniref:CRIB domain-containing protein n=1 Tax=Panagrellus redivivus TaxID=6233 RepID=A0A7E4V216_PANRE
MEHSLPKLTHKLVDVMQFGMKTSASAKKRRAPIAKSDISSPQDPCHLAHMGFDSPHPSPDMVPREIDGNTVYINKRADEMLRGVNIGDPIYVGDERSVDNFTSYSTPPDTISQPHPVNTDADIPSKTSTFGTKEPLISVKNRAAPLPPSAHTCDKATVKTKERQQLFQKAVHTPRYTSEASLTLVEIDERLQNLQVQMDQLLELRRKVVLGSSGTQSFDEYSDTTPEEFTKVNIIEADDDSVESVKSKEPAVDPSNAGVPQAEKQLTRPKSLNNVAEVNENFELSVQTDNDKFNSQVSGTVADSSKIRLSAKVKGLKRQRRVHPTEPSIPSGLTRSQSEAPNATNDDLNEGSVAKVVVDNSVNDSEPINVNVPTMNIRIRKTASPKPGHQSKRTSCPQEEASNKPIPPPRRIRPGVENRKPLPQFVDNNTATSSQSTETEPHLPETNITRF